MVIRSNITITEPTCVHWKLKGNGVWISIYPTTYHTSEAVEVMPSPVSPLVYDAFFTYPVWQPNQSVCPYCQDAARILVHGD